MVQVPMVRGLTVCLESNGQPLPEFNDDTLENEGDVVSRYVQSVVGTRFTVVCKLGPFKPSKGDGIVIRIHADGKYADSIVLKKKKVAKGFTFVSKGPHISSTMVLPFRFSALDIHESSTAGDPAKTKSLGRITIEMSQAWLLEHSRFRGTHVEEAEPVSEKALKGQALSCAVGYDVPEPSAIGHGRATEDIGGPLATVHLYYRSEDDLKAMYIIQPPEPQPQPQPQSQSQHAATCTCGKDVKPVKRELDDDTSQPRKRVRDMSKVMMVLEDDGSFREVFRPEGSTSATPVTLD